LRFYTTGGIHALDVARNTEIHALDMALGVIRRRVFMKHRCELRFRSHRPFTHASLSRVPLCVSWAFLVSSCTKSQTSREVK